MSCKILVRRPKRQRLLILYYSNHQSLKIKSKHDAAISKYAIRKKLFLRFGRISNHYIMQLKQSKFNVELNNILRCINDKNNLTLRMKQLLSFRFIYKSIVFNVSSCRTMRNTNESSI